MTEVYLVPSTKRKSRGCLNLNIYSKANLRPYVVSSTYFYRRLGSGIETSDPREVFRLLGEFESRLVDSKMYLLINPQLKLFRYCGVGNRIVSPLLYKNEGPHDITIELEFELNGSVEVYLPKSNLMMSQTNFTQQFTIEKGEVLKLFVLNPHIRFDFKVTEVVLTSFAAVPSNKP
jgi:hypothetical protein